MSNDHGVPLRDALMATGGPWSRIDETLESAAELAPRWRVDQEGRIISLPDNKPLPPWEQFRKGELFADLKTGRRVVCADRPASPGDWSAKVNTTLPPEFWQLADWEFVDLSVGFAIRDHTDHGVVDYINPVVKRAGEMSAARQRIDGTYGPAILAYFERNYDELWSLETWRARARQIAKHVGCELSTVEKILRNQLTKRIRNGEQKPPFGFLRRPLK